MEKIKAIETEYNGYRFRSRLEARWAVFFDNARIRYEYEVEGFEAPDGTRYLPDFYLPEYDWYVEIKPPRPEAEKEISKAVKFIGDEIKVLLILGNIPPETDKDAYHYPVLVFNAVRKSVMVEYVLLWAEHRGNDLLDIGFVTWLYVDNESQYATEPVLKRVIEKGAIHDRKMFREYARNRGNANEEIPAWCDVCDDDDYNISMVHLSSAYRKARQARFEYGENK